MKFWIMFCIQTLKAIYDIGIHGKCWRGNFFKALEFRIYYPKESVIC